MALNYRPEIDGLRAVAVLPVIVYHAGITQSDQQLLSGGYVGVDVFFVISGYLIAALLLQEHSAGQFSLARFYERRARRILPALLLVVSCSIPFAWLWMDAVQLENFGSGMAAVTLFASNFLFWQQTGYFEGPAEFNPLLHTWSLAVEEQFYLFFPLLLLLAWRFASRHLMWLFGAGLLASLATAQWLQTTAPDAGFFLPHSRAWELLAGACAALYERKHGRDRAPALKTAAPTLGLVMIFLACLIFDEYTGVPGIAALLPVTGTLLVILYGGGDDVGSRLLTHKWVVAIGLLSYSLYLWHQPVFVFARMYAQDELLAVDYAGLFLLCLCLATVSYRTVEKPFRNRQFLSPRTIASALFAGSALLLGAGLLLAMQGGFPQRIAQEFAFLGQYRKYPYQAMFRDRQCLLHPDQGFSELQPECFATTNPEIILWGDSHAAAMYPGIAELYGSHRVTQLTTASCPPVLGLRMKGVPQCEAINEAAFRMLAEHQSAEIILHAYWTVYRPFRDTGLAHNAEDYLRLLDSTLARLAARGKQVTVLGSLPVWYPGLPDRLLKYTRIHGELPASMALPHSPPILTIDGHLASMSKRHGHRFVSLVNVLCPGGECRITLPASDGTRTLMQWDASHPTREGADYIIRKALPPIAKPKTNQ